MNDGAAVLSFAGHHTPEQGIWSWVQGKYMKRQLFLLHTRMQPWQLHA
jgi:hypothetical protein